MFSITVSNISSAIGQIEKEIRSEVKILADNLFQEIKQRTPVATGHARSGWSKKVTDKDFTIENPVPYIGVLDKGRHMTNRGMRGSKQAPKGIVTPSLDAIKRKN
jgi:hypothetical protein